MTEVEKEKIYDDEIAPLLLQAAQKATEVGIPLTVIAEWNTSRCGTTDSGVPSNTVEMVLGRAGVRCRGNLDSLVLGVLRWANENNIRTEASMIANMIARLPS